MTERGDHDDARDAERKSVQYRRFLRQPGPALFQTNQCGRGQAGDRHLLGLDVGIYALDNTMFDG